MFGCLFGFLVPYYGDVTIIGEGLQILTYARHSLPLSSEGYLVWHEAAVYILYLRGPVTLASIAERLAVELSLYLFYDLGLSWLGFEHLTFRLRGVRSNPLRHRRGIYYIKVHTQSELDTCGKVVRNLGSV